MLLRLTKLLLMGALAAAIQLTPQPCFAGDGARDAEQRALVMFEQSEELYSAGKFEDAAKLLEEAYALHPEPLLLYNLARAREGYGDFRGAADAYKEYLKLAPKSADRAAIDKRIETLEQRLAEEDQLQRDRDSARDELAKREGEPEPEAPTDEPGVLEGPLPWVILGVGAVGIGVGIGLGVSANSKHDEAEAEPVQAEAVELQKSAEDLALGATISFIAGGAIAATGGLLGIIGLAGADDGDTALMVGPSSITVRGSF